ncbi:MAG: hypothetical protein DRN68_01455 [Thaumarchaeota archaeon]|nr:MAG: hypothetical protein DRN68_01455 [Nitrososphaerota archaeon]
MLWAIVHKEIQSNVISSRFLILSSLCVGLFVITAFTIFQEMELNYREYRSNLIGHREAMAREPSLISLAAISGVKVDRRPEPLGFFARGIEAARSRIYRVTSYDVTPIGGSDLERNPFVSISGPLDFLYLFQVVVSLLALLLASDAISGEKESGTLKLLISHNVPRHTILLGKFFGNYFTLLIPLSISAIAVGAVMSFYSFPFGGDEWKRMAVMLVLSAIYLAAMLEMGLLISSVTKKPSISFLASIVAWVVSVIAIPKIAFHLGAAIAPPPSVAALQNRMRAITNEADVKALTEIRKYIEERGQPPPKEWLEELSRKVMEENNAKKAKLQQEFDNRLARTFRVSSMLARLSPSSSYTFAMQEMARTGFNDDIRFRRAVSEFKEKFAEYMEMRMKGISSNIEDNMPQLGKKLDLTGMPTFSYRESRFGDAVGHITLDVLVLLTFNVIFFLAAYMAFLRYDVR